MAKPPRIAFWGNFGTGNWGNECTLQAIVYNARAWVPDAELLCVCTEPTDTEARHGLRSFPISHVRRQLGERMGKRPSLPARFFRRAWLEALEWAKTFQIARELDTVVMTGTGMLTDDSEGPFGLPYDLFKWSVAAKACGSRVLFASVGVEPIDSPVARFFILTALRLADYRSYRDAQSREHLARVGFSSDRDHVYPDLAFSLPGAKVPAANDGAAAAPKIAVGIYNYKDRGQNDAAGAAKYKDYLEKMASFVMWLLERGYAVRVLIGDLTYDEQVVFDLREVLRQKDVARFGDLFVDQPATSVEEVMQQIAEVEVVVASRFHNVLLALLLGKPVVSIAYNQNNDALMTPLGLEAYCQSIDDLDLGRLIDQFSQIRANADALRGAIRQKAASNRGELDEQYEAVFARGPRPKPVTESRPERALEVEDPR
jgi:polysaccharide pyruvyl transferase WcaK-like protein